MNVDNEPRQATNARAIYEAKKKKIDKWYDEDYSRKQGIQPWGKPLHSNHPWYQKTVAWMKHMGLAEPPKKKRKLNDGETVSGEVQDNRPLRPHQIRYPGDIERVPDYPWDSLEDYRPMENGRYACSHVHLEPLKQCCKFGLTKDAKRQSIKKDILRWKAKIEKLVDKRLLDKRHMTWTDWTVPQLRKKHQRGLWDQQEAKKQADIERKRREEERQRKKGQAEMGGSSAMQTANQKAAQQHPAIQREAPVTDPQRRPSTHSTFTNDSPVATPASQPPAPMQTQRLIAPMRRRSDPNAIVSGQGTFLTNLARTNPRPLRTHDALYHDAQYRENLKEQPNFVLLKKWYLAYFLKQQKQPLSVEQRMLLDKGDPSYDGKKRVGGVPALERIDELFGEYLRAAKGERVAQHVQQKALQILSQPFTTPTPSVGIYAASAVHDTDGLIDDAHVRTAVILENQSVLQAPFEIWDYERIDSELDRILGTGPVYRTQTAAWNLEAVPQDTPILQSEASYLTTLPAAFSTGNQAVDDEAQKLLEYAYQTEPTPDGYISEDERLLRQTIEDSRSDWQRYCDFFGDEQSQSDDPARMEEPVVDEFDFGELLSEEQLAVFDFDDPVGQQLFARHDARVATAHAANLARYR